MQRLEITGETPDELYFNCIKTLSLLLQGATAPVPSMQGQDAAPAGAGSQPVSLQEDAGSTPAAALDGEVVPPKKRGRPAKVSAAELNDPLPDGFTGADPNVKPLTLDGDIRPMCQAIQQACVKRGMKMPECVEYIQRLYAPFGIGHVKELDPKHFAEFMDAADAYLKGEA